MRMAWSNFLFMCSNLAVPATFSIVFDHVKVLHITIERIFEKHNGEQLGE